MSNNKGNKMKIKTILIGCLFFCVSFLDLFGQSSRGEKAFLENNPEEAILFLEEEINSGTASSKAYNFLGLAYFQLGNFEESVKAFDKGLKVQYGNGISDIVIGSGFFIDERGYIVTNYHVIESEVDPEYEGYSRLYIKTSKDSETKVPAKVIGYDSVMDLALLKTEITPDFVFQLGSSENLEIGDQIYAIGSPLGLEKTITSGIISTTDRKITTLGTVMQLDASVNAGNSGGPAVSKEGLVQGVVFAGITGYLKLSILVLLATLLFQLVTLPVEFDASKRAGIQLEKLGIIDVSEKSNCMNVLKAAALTYVASLASTVLNILRLVLMLASRNDD